MDVRLRAQLAQALKAPVASRAKVLRNAFRCLCATAGASSASSTDLFVLCAETALHVRHKRVCVLHVYQHARNDSCVL